MSEQPSNPETFTEEYYKRLKETERIKVINAKYANVDESQNPDLYPEVALRYKKLKCQHCGGILSWETLICSTCGFKLPLETYSHKEKEDDQIPGRQESEPRRAA